MQHTFFLVYLLHPINKMTVQQFYQEHVHRMMAK
jgi:hypothetical protein